VATLAGYALLWLELHDRTAHVVIRRGTTQFHRPVRSELRAVCRTPDAATMTAFRSDFARKGKARLTLRVEIAHESQLAVEFEGVFVAVR
jgi:thioesterase domain-containing protein